MGLQLCAVLCKGHKDCAVVSFPSLQCPREANFIKGKGFFLLRFWRFTVQDRLVWPPGMAFLPVGFPWRHRDWRGKRVCLSVCLSLESHHDLTMGLLPNNLLPSDHSQKAPLLNTIIGSSSHPLIPIKTWGTKSVTHKPLGETQTNTQTIAGGLSTGNQER